MTTRTYKEVQKDTYLYCANYYSIARRAVGGVETREDGSVCINGYIEANGERIFSDAYRLHQNGIDLCNKIIIHLKGCIETCKRDALEVYNNDGKPISVGKGKKTNELWE